MGIRRTQGLCSWVAAVVVIALGFGACGDDATPAASSAAGEPSGGNAPSIPFTGLEEDLPVGIPEPKPKPLTVAFSSPLQAQEANRVMVRAATLETERLGGTMIVTDAKAQVDAQVSHVEQAVARGVDAIAILPIDPGAVAPVLKRAAEAGIPVIGVDVNLAAPDPGRNFTSQIYARRDFTAYLQAKEAARLLPQGATVGQIGFAIPVPPLERLVTQGGMWLERFGLEPVGRANSMTDDIAGGEKPGTELISQHPQLQGIIAYNEESATGAAAAARAAGKPDLTLIGGGGGTVGFESVRSGRIAATVQSQRVDVGRLAVWAAYTANAGGKVPKTILTPEPVLVTSDNVDSVPTWEQQLRERYDQD